MRRDPYAVLELAATASDDELRAAHRRLVRRHHPDHGGSAARFAEVQEAYARIRAERAAADVRRAGESEIEQRLAAIERELQAERERAGRSVPPPTRVPRTTAASAKSRKEPREERASDEELGYVRTEDSFTRIIDDWLEGRR